MLFQMAMPLEAAEPVSGTTTPMVIFGVSAKTRVGSARSSKGIMTFIVIHLHIR